MPRIFAGSPFGPTSTDWFENTGRAHVPFPPVTNGSVGALP